MEFFISLSKALSGVIHPYLPKVALSLVATILFLFGEDIHGLVKNQIKNYHFLVRVFILILVCAFGYGMLTIFCTILIERVLECFDALWLAPAVIGAFFLIGILAERKKAI